MLHTRVALGGAAAGTHHRPQSDLSPNAGNALRGMVDGGVWNTKGTKGHERRETLSWFSSPFVCFVVRTLLTRDPMLGFSIGRAESGSLDPGSAKAAPTRGGATACNRYRRDVRSFCSGHGAMALGMLHSLVLFSAAGPNRSAV